MTFIQIDYPTHKHMKTYAEINGRKPFDWNKALNQDEITCKQWIDLEDRAKDWVSCACGNQCDIIPRDTNGQPFDKALSDLGGHFGFYGAILDRDAKQAKVWLSLIEFRSAQILAEMNDKAKA